MASIRQTVSRIFGKKEESIQGLQTKMPVATSREGGVIVAGGSVIPPASSDIPGKGFVPGAGGFGGGGGSGGGQPSQPTPTTSLNVPESQPQFSPAVERTREASARAAALRAEASRRGIDISTRAREMGFVKGLRKEYESERNVPTGGQSLLLEEGGMSRPKPTSIFFQDGGQSREPEFFDVETRPHPKSFGLGRVPYSAKYRDEFGNVREATSEELSQINVYGVEQAATSRGLRAKRSPKIITDLSRDIEKYTGRTKESIDKNLIFKGISGFVTGKGTPESLKGQAFVDTLILGSIMPSSKMRIPTELDIPLRQTGKAKSLEISFTEIVKGKPIQRSIFEIVGGKKTSKIKN